MSNLSNEVESLIKKSEQEKNSLHALQLSQAALNAAHALRVLADMPNTEQKT